MKKLFNDFAVAETECASSVCFVGIDVHSGSELFAYSDNNVIKNRSSFGIDLNLYDLFVCNVELCSSFGSKVDMSFSNNSTLTELNLTLGANKLTCTTTCCVTAFANGSNTAD